jgi:hypothetical protein
MRSTVVARREYMFIGRDLSANITWEMYNNWKYDRCFAKCITSRDPFPYLWHLCDSYNVGFLKVHSNDIAYKR